MTARVVRAEPKTSSRIEQRERLPGTLGCHLGDGQAEDEIRQILLATRNDGFGDRVLEHDDVVLLVELESPSTGRR